MILLFSGPAAVGKSTICAELEKFHGFMPIKSSGYLRSLADQKCLIITRNTLQELGDQLDLETNFSWLVENVAKVEVKNLPEQMLWYVDSVRKPKQIECFRRAFGTRVFHAHIDASESVLKNRFAQRLNAKGNSSYEKPYSEHINHPNEISSRSLGEVADIVIEYSKLTSGEAARTILNHGVAE